MNTYTVESVNGKTCRHRAVTIEHAAQLHTRRHIRADAAAWRLEGPHGFFQAMEGQIGKPLPIRQPFRVVVS